jgi:hypothetical protein
MMSWRPPVDGDWALVSLEVRPGNSSSLRLERPQVIDATDFSSLSSRRVYLKSAGDDDLYLVIPKPKSAVKRLFLRLAS